MPSYNITVNLGSGEEGQKRDKAYRDYADKKGTKITKLMRDVMDKEVGFKKPA